MNANMTDKAPLFDRNLILTRRKRMALKADDNFIIKAMGTELQTRLEFVERTFNKALIISPDVAILKTRFKGWEKLGDVDYISLFDDTGFDDEKLDIAPQSLDLIVHLGGLQIANQLPETLARLRHALKPDGLMLAGFIGGDSLTELRTSFLSAEADISGAASLRVAPFVSVQDAGKLLQWAGFALPVVDVEPLTIRHDNLIALIKDLRLLSATNPMLDRPQKMMTRTILAAAGTHYHTHFSDPDGRIRTLLEIIWVSGWAPDVSQQKPLKPGSAKMSLKDVLPSRDK